MTLEWVLLALRLSAVAVLYVFLAIAIYVVWRDLRLSSAGAPARTSVDDTLADDPTAWLRVLESNEAQIQGNDIFALSSPATIGRAPDNQVGLLDSDVSLYHARIEYRNAEWWLMDLDSRNGTRLNKVTISECVQLADGDVIGVGRLELVFEIENKRNEK